MRDIPSVHTGRWHPSRPLHQTQSSHRLWETWALVVARKTWRPAVWVSLAPGKNYQLSLKVWLFCVLELDCLRRWETLGLRRVKAGAGIMVGTCIPLPYNALWGGRTSKTAKNVPAPLSGSFKFWEQNLGVPFGQGCVQMSLVPALLLFRISAQTAMEILTRTIECSQRNIGKMANLPRHGLESG